MFDLSSIKPKESMLIVFRDGNGTQYTDDKGNEIGLLVSGPTLPEHIKAREKMFREINKNAELPKMKQDPKAAEKAGIAFLRAVALQPVGFQIRDLKDKECLEAFFSEPEWKLFVDQVLGYLLNPTNFLPTA